MPFYRKKPVTIQAIQWVGNNWPEIQMFCPNAVLTSSNELYINTIEGPLHSSHNDWIIKGVQGEFYPCKPDIFAETYEEA